MYRAIFYSCLLVSVFVGSLFAATDGTLTTVSTFNSISVTWVPLSEGGTACTLEYKKSIDETWSDALDMFWDSAAGEYRGSIVLLDSNTNYDIRATNVGGSYTLAPVLSDTDAPGSNSTWSETFNVGSATYLDQTSSSTYTISASGSDDSYILYTFNPAVGSATIDVNNSANYNIQLQNGVHHVIIRGITMLDAAVSGINLVGNNHHIVIEDCDISNWGDGTNGQAAIYSLNYTDAQAPYALVIQRNRLHDPRVGANGWETGHPLGPQGIFFARSLGNMVIRYNSIYSTDEHWFNDAMGNWQNSGNGWPYKDTDIYGNYISNCRDDGIESEGGNENVRIWNNFITQTFVPIAIAEVNIGPIYIWRNVSSYNRKWSNQADPDDWERGPFIKAGGSTAGKTYIFNNTTLQPDDGETRTIGVDGGIKNSGGTIYNTISRNNIMLNYKTSNVTFIMGTTSETNDLDYDLYTGTISNSGTQQVNGINDVPTFDGNETYTISNQTGEVKAFLTSGSNGRNAGIAINNFTDGYEGVAPDMGAFEYGSGSFEVGVDAYEVSSISAPSSLQVLGGATLQ